LQLSAVFVASWFTNIEDMDEDIATQGCPTCALALSVPRDLAYGAYPSGEAEALAARADLPSLASMQ
jgi:hypothetical protein